MHDFGLRKVSPASRQVGFLNLRHFFQHRSLAKHWFKNLKSLAYNCCLVLLFCHWLIQWNEHFLHHQIFNTFLLVKFTLVIHFSKRAFLHSKIYKWPQDFNTIRFTVQDQFYVQLFYQGLTFSLAIFKFKKPILNQEI